MRYKIPVENIKSSVQRARKIVKSDFIIGKKMAESILRKVKCLVCGRKLLPSKRQSHKAGKKYVGYCFTDSHPRLKFVILDTTKNHDDPDADRHVDVKISDSDW